MNEVLIYINNNWNTELNTIKQEKSAWTFIMTMKVTEGKGGEIKFPIPITAWNLIFYFHSINSNKPSTFSNEKNKGTYSNPYRNYEYKSFNYSGYSNNVHIYSIFSVNNKEMINCPRCNTIVDDNRGVYSTCGEKYIPVNFLLKHQLWAFGSYSLKWVLTFKIWKIWVCSSWETLDCYWKSKERNDENGNRK